MESPPTSLLSLPLPWTKPPHPQPWLHLNRAEPPPCAQDWLTPTSSQIPNPKKREFIISPIFQMGKLRSKGKELIQVLMVLVWPGRHFNPGLLHSHPGFFRGLKPCPTPALAHACELRPSSVDGAAGAQRVVEAEKPGREGQEGKQFPCARWKNWLNTAQRGLLSGG